VFQNRGTSQLIKIVGSTFASFNPVTNANGAKLIAYGRLLG
jgi:hypothetical protein